MSNKVRIHDLAKKYGMSGKDMAAKLRDLGFSKARSHMSALDEFEQLQAEGVLQAYGILPNASEQAGEAAPGGGIVVRKKKKKKAAAPEPTSEPVGGSASPPSTGATADAPVDSPAESTTESPAVSRPAGNPAGEPAVSTTAETELGEVAARRRSDAETHPPTSDAPAAVAESSAPPPAAGFVDDPAAALPPVVETSSSSAAAPAESSTESETTSASAPTSTSRPAATEPDQPPPSADLEPGPDREPAQDGSGERPAPSPSAAPESIEEPEASSGSDEPTIPRPAAASPEAESVDTPVAEATPAAAADDKKARPRGNVVGFIDPSKFQSNQPARRKSMSRRLQSRDDAAPDVRPTFSHGRGPGSGGGPRGNLTAAQLRERESGRFLRRNRGAQGAAPRRGGRGGQTRQVTESPLAGTTVSIQAPITPAKLAEAIKLKANVVLKTALQEGIGLMNLNASIDEDTAILLADAFDVDLKITHEVAAEEALLDDLRATREAVDEKDLFLRPPTVAFLGHVDHGKTTLIDCIRSSRVAEGEAGGITQHIGAYRVTTKQGHPLTIVDTPGHAAFTAMRARGAKAVDIVVLVVAGDDGVKPHTEEAYNHAKAAGTPIIVAITKKDRPEYDAQKTQTQLAAMGLNPEEWGGDTAMIQVSALQNEGVDELLERVFLEGELLELKAHPEGPASGVVIEAEKQQGKGIVAHLLVQDGTLRTGDVILAGEGYGKVRSMHDDLGQLVKEAGPSMPVEVAGLDALPGVGTAFHVVDKLARAKEVALERERANRAVALAESRTPNPAMDAILGKAPAVERKSINLIIRADVQGSVEVLKHAVSELVHDEVEVKIVHIGVGPITESDVDLAVTSDALLVAFHVGVGSKARSEAERQGLRIVRFDVIYELIDQIRNLMEGALSPEFNEKISGHAEIRRIFKSSKIGLIAGCMVIDGSIQRDAQIRLLRDDTVIHTGVLASLRREAEDVRVVREGFECGLVIKNYGDIREGDIIEAFRMVEVKRTLEGSSKKN